MENENITNTTNNVKTNETKKPRASFKERWLETDKLCPHCGQVTERVRGLNKQNLKRLFSLKMSMNDYITFFIIIMILFAAWSYNHDIAVCREYLKQDRITVDYINSQRQNQQSDFGININYSVADSLINGSGKPVNE